MLRLSTLSEWLAYLQTLHKETIQLGLERVHTILQQLGISHFPCPVITVAGTNGKGSTVKMLEATYHSAGYKVATFTSPALFTFNEQIRINEEPISDTRIIAAFERITEIRGFEALTPFEFHTVAALLIFNELPLDVIVLEVGLGGRLDAVNAIDADVAVITNISLDHTDYLGHTRNAIGREKAGILRSQKPAVFGDWDMPNSIEEVALLLKTPLFRLGADFSFERDQEKWHWHSIFGSLSPLPLPTLLLENVSSALMVIFILQARLPVSAEAIRLALQAVKLPGRLQVLTLPIAHIVDVSHNPASIAHLAVYLEAHPIAGRTLAIFSMLADKDISTSVDIIKPYIDEWWIAKLDDKRAADVLTLNKIFTKATVTFHLADTIESAYLMALKQAKVGDRLVVFGSFHTVKEVFANKIKL